eukprot:1987213-Prymnesium_polylepis.1
MVPCVASFDDGVAWARTHATARRRAPRRGSWRRSTRIARACCTRSPTRARLCGACTTATAPRGTRCRRRRCTRCISR